MSEAIKPDYRIFAIDETHNWAEEITAITGKIAGVYVVNFAEVTHLCSLTGSYWAAFVCNITEHEIREPDGYSAGVPIWDDEFMAEYPDIAGRSKALVTAWNGPFYGLAYENGGETGMYLGESFTPAKSSPIELDAAEWAEDTSEMSADDAERYRSERDKAAMEAVQEYMANGEEWADLAPWAHAKGE